VTDLVTIGECMVELSRRDDGFALAYGGDTFNTAAYASRLGLAVAYGTALGDDPYSDAILALAGAEGIATDAVPRLAGRVPGLYVIETDERGERRFYYWRGEAPARELFERPEAAQLVKTMAAARCVYFSGITLSLYSPAGLDAFEAALRSARTAGATIAFDGNFRPRGWRHDAERAHKTVGRFLPLVDIALPTHDDEVLLWGDQDESETLDRLAEAGVGEVALKQGGAGAVLWQRGGEGHRVAVPETVTPVDTTAAGDSFNAGYLAARLEGETPEAAALLGHRLAAVVIRHRGAIVPREATDAVRRGSSGSAATGQ
jgi:2-dehydro-3-deoxygluconokinase